MIECKGRFFIYAISVSLLYVKSELSLYIHLQQFAV